MDSREIQYRGVTSQRTHIEDSLRLNQETAEYLRGGKDKLLEVGQAKTTDVSGLTAEEKDARITAWERRYLTGNPTFMVFAKKALELPEKECDASMQQVRSSLRNLITMEKVYRGLVGQAVKMDQLNQARAEFMDSCRNYATSHNPFFSKAKARKSLVLSMLHIGGDVQDVPMLQGIVMKTENEEDDTHVVQIADTKIAQLRAQYDRDLNAQGLSKKEKKALKAIGEYVSFHKVGYHDEYAALAAKAKQAVEDCLSMKSTVISVTKYAVLLTQLTGGNLVPMQEGVDEGPFERITVRDTDELTPLNPSVDANLATKMHLITLGSKKDVPLFGRMPSVHDIKQRFLGDCYLLAALSSLASVNPQAIKDRMRENEDGTVTVRFYKKYSSTDFRNYYTNREFGNTHAATWCDGFDCVANLAQERETDEIAQWVEKAFAQNDGSEYAELEGYSELKAEWDSKIGPIQSELDALLARQNALKDDVARAKAAKADFQTDPTLLENTRLTKEIRAKQRAIGQEQIDMNIVERARPLYQKIARSLGASSVKLAERVRVFPNEQEVNIRGLAAFYKRLAASEDEKDRQFANAFSQQRFSRAILQYSDEEWAAFLTKYGTDIEKSRGARTEFVPIDVTVEKTVPQMMIYGDAYARDALWVQMIEKAYAASGLRSNQFDAVKGTFLQSDIQKQYEELVEKAGPNPDPQTLERIRQQIIHSYYGMEGGNSEEFLTHFLGEEVQRNERSFLSNNIALFDRNLHNEEQEKKRAEAIKNGMDAQEAETQFPNLSEEPTYSEMLSNSLREYVRSLDETQYPAFFHSGEDMFFRVFAGEIINKLEAVVVERKLDILHIEDALDALDKAIYESALHYHSQALPEILLGENPPEPEVAIKQVQEALASLKALFKQFFVTGYQTGAFHYGDFSDLQYRPHAEQSDAYHDSVGRYTDEADRIFATVERKLAVHFPVCAGTRHFDSSMKGPNGEGYSEGVYGGHAYSVVGTLAENGKKYLILRNPHAVTGRGYEYRVKADGTHEYHGIEHHGGSFFTQGYNEWKGKELPEGIFRIELNDFLHFFDARNM